MTMQGHTRQTLSKLCSGAPNGRFSCTAHIFFGQTLRRRILSFPLTCNHLRGLAFDSYQQLLEQGWKTFLGNLLSSG